MVAVMVEPEQRPAMATGREHDVCCPHAGCGRHLGSVHAYAAIPPRLVWTKRQCPSCRRWAWFDAATGEAAHRPLPPTYLTEILP